jgi:Zn ribbon nucleic-acid-binding protein
MTARDRWQVDLHCPKCGNSGTANLWQEDGWSFSNGDQSTHIDSLPEGFRAQPQKSGALKFFCAKCEIEAR